MADQKKYINKLNDSRVLIVGGTSGLGFSVAEACVEYGAIVTIASSSPERVKTKTDALEESYPSAKSRIHSVVVDLSARDTLESDVKKMFEETARNMPGGKLDHVIFSAGDPLATMTLQDVTMDKILSAGQIRFFAPLMIAKFLPTYLENSSQSSYTITGGAVAEHPTSGWTVVASYAGGLHGMTRNLALDLKPIRVNCIQPGAVDTELWKMGEEEKQKFMESLTKRLATGKVGRPEEVAQTYLAAMMDTNMDATILRSDSGGLIM